MPSVPHDQNRRTQPHGDMRVFNNWNIVAEGWYIACRSRDLAPGALRSIEIADQRLVVFRGQDGAARALDAFCPHMGTDLAEGTVVGDSIRCFFHHWRFDGEGRCVDVPATPGCPAAARVPSYATSERYGYVWVWPAASAPGPIVEFPELSGSDLVIWHHAPIERTCHHHVCMINGIDPQHLATVHQINIQMDLSVEASADGRVLDVHLDGPVPDTWRGRLLRRWIGPRYRYSMRYADGSLGLLTTMKDMRLGGVGAAFPSLHMVYAYTPLARGKIRIQPFFVARRRSGVFGWMWTRILLLVTRIGYRALQGEDGRVYDHMRFSPSHLLTMDQPIVRFMAYVNRLTPSVWSRT